MRSSVSLLLSAGLVLQSFPSYAANRGTLGTAPSVPKLTLPALPTVALPQTPTLTTLPSLPVSIALPKVAAAAPAAAVTKGAVPTVQTLRLMAPKAEAARMPAAEARAESERVWSGAGKAETAAVDAELPASPAAEAPSQARLAPAPKAKARRAASALLMGGAATALPPAAPMALPHWLGAALTEYAPYAYGLGGMGLTYGATRLVRWAVNKIAKRGGWDANKTVAVRLVASMATWAAGATASLHFAGVSSQALLTTLGVGGIAVTMSAKEFIGNLLEGVKVLMSHPFQIGDSIILGDKIYKVRGLNLRYLELDRYKKSTTLMTFTQLGSKPITVQREYQPERMLKLQKPKLGFKGVLSAAAGERPSLLKATAWAGAAVLLLAGLPQLKTAVGFSWFQTLFPMLHGGVVLFATRQVEKWALGFVDRLAAKAGWSQQTTVVARLVAQLIVYAVGGTFALHAFGATWTAVLASLGATSIAVGWASSDVISNLIQGFWILFSRPFRVEDVIEVAGVTGRVVDMNLQYVVLEHSDKTHTLIPYSVIRDSAFTVLDPSEADTSAPKPNADANRSPKERSDAQGKPKE